MLLRFAVENHLSICERQELSFAASSLRDQREGLIECNAVSSGSVLPAIVIYGANASGKSNILDAIATMKHWVLWSHARGEPGGGIPRKPFKLDSMGSQVPSKFEIDFIVDGVRYHYGFEATDKVFVKEWLYAYPISHRRMLFERHNREFVFGRELKGQNKNIAGLTRPNSLFLSVAAQNDHEQLSKIYEYFQSIKVARSIHVRGVEASARFVGDALDKRVIDFLASINTGVIGYQKKKTDIPEADREIRRGIKAVIERFSDGPVLVRMEPDGEDEQVAIQLAHRNRQGEPVYFDLDSESAGTRRLLIVLSLAYQALDKGLVLCIDEVDASLHTLASEAVMTLFCLPEINRKGAQLIATTHDTHLMRSAVLRRDQLWFTEKTPGGATELYPLTDIRTRKGDNIELGYLQGRFGALPSDDMISQIQESS